MLHDLFLAPFELGFLRRALAGCIALSLAGPPLGVFLVLRGLEATGGGGLICTGTGCAPLNARERVPEGARAGAMWARTCVSGCPVPGSGTRLGKPLLCK